MPLRPRYIARLCLPLFTFATGILGHIGGSPASMNWSACVGHLEGWTFTTIREEDSESKEERAK